MGTVKRTRTERRGGTKTRALGLSVEVMIEGHGSSWTAYVTVGQDHWKRTGIRTKRRAEINAELAVQYLVELAESA